jgi:hypothetical protein
MHCVEVFGKMTNAEVIIHGKEMEILAFPALCEPFRLLLTCEGSRISRRFKARFGRDSPRARIASLLTFLRNKAVEKVISIRFAL